MSQIQVKLVVVGDGAVGKTCLLYLYMNNQFPEDYVPTVFDNYTMDIELDGKQIQLGVWDTAGQEDYDRIRPLSYPGTNVFLVCYSIVSPTSYENVKSKWYPEVSHHCAGVPLLLIGTKEDLRNDEDCIKKLAQSDKHPVTEAEAEQLRKAIKAEKHIFCSAKTQVNVKLVFDSAIRVVLAPKKKKKCGFM